MKLLKYFINFVDEHTDFIVSILILLVAILIIFTGADSKKYDVIFDKYELSEPITIEVRHYGYIMGDGSFMIEKTEKVDVDSGRRVGHFVYDDFTFYAYIDYSRDNSSIGVNSMDTRFSVTLPLFMSDDYLKVDKNKVEEKYYSEYVFVLSEIYTEGVFGVIEELYNNPSKLDLKFILSYWNYLTNGEGWHFILSTSLGVLLISIFVIVVKIICNWLKKKFCLCSDVYSVTVKNIINIKQKIILNYCNRSNRKRRKQ